MKSLSQIFCGFALVALGATPAVAAPLALEPDENLTFEINWGLLGKAGEISITAETAMVLGEPRVKLVSETSTKGFVRLLYRFDGVAQSIFEPKSGHLLLAKAETASRGKKTKASIVIDHERNVANYVDHLDDTRSQQRIPMPEGDPLDFITTLVATRQWDIKVGEERPALVLFDDEFYELIIRAEERVTIDTRWGPREALRLVPRMEGEPRGMFKRGGEISVWVSTDTDHLPLQFQVKVKWGTAWARLSHYKLNEVTTPPNRHPTLAIDS